MTTTTRALSSDPWGQQNNTGLDTDIGQLLDLDAETVRRARLVVCSRSTDADDAAELLGALGIDARLAANRSAPAGGAS